MAIEAKLFEALVPEDKRRFQAIPPLLAGDINPHEERVDQSVKAIEKVIDMVLAKMLEENGNGKNIEDIIEASRRALQQFLEDDLRRGPLGIKHTVSTSPKRAPGENISITMRIKIPPEALVDPPETMPITSYPQNKMLPFGVLKKLQEIYQATGWYSCAFQHTCLYGSYVMTVQLRRRLDPVE